MRKLHTLVFALFVCVAHVLTAAAENDAKSLYDKGVEAYHSADYASALQVLQELRAEFPNDRLADEAQLYIGRIHSKTGQRDKAIEAFRSVIAVYGRAKLHREASYDLAQLFFKSKEYGSVAELLEPLKKTDNLSSRDDKILRLLAQARQALGVVALREYRNADARANLEEAVRINELLLAGSPEEKEKAQEIAGRGEAYARLKDVAPSADSYQTYVQKAEESLAQAVVMAKSEKERTRLLGLLSDVRTADKVRLSGSVVALGGAQNASITGSTFLKPGALITADLLLHLPLAWHEQLVLTGGFTHDDFVLKTYAYPASMINTGAARIVRTENTFSGEIAWEAGSRRQLFSQLSVSGAYTMADDPADNSWRLKAKEMLAWRVSPAWKLGFDLDGQWVAFPNYTSLSGRGLDYASVSANPHATWYVVPELNITLGNDFTFKQFLNAKYDQLVSAGPSPVTTPATLDKEFFTDTASVIAKANLGAILHPSLGYSFAYRKTANDDVLVTGTPVNQFVGGYYDSIEHKVRAGIGFSWTKDFNTVLGASVAFRSFLNFPAQDPTRTFTGGLRADRILDLNAEIQYRIWSKAQNGFGDLLADVRATYRNAASNMTYEHLDQTNYQTLEVVAGVDLLLP